MDSFEAGPIPRRVQAGWCVIARANHYLLPHMPPGAKRYVVAGDLHPQAAGLQQPDP